MRLSSDELDFLTRVRDGGRLKPADRVEDRLRQRMRKIGFAVVAMDPRRWVITPAGLEAIKQAEERA